VGHLFRYNSQQSNDGEKRPMKNLKLITKGAILILLSGMLLSSCTAGAPATPTIDPNALFTQVAQTVMVSITQTAAAMPTKTPMPTNTPMPTPMLLPTEDLSLTPTSQPFLPGYPTPTVMRYGDAAQWYGQGPMDSLTYSANQKVNFTGCMRNIGTTTWNTGYYLRLVGGPNLWGTANDWKVGAVVKPGGNWCWTWIPGTMPAAKGVYTTWFYFYSDKNKYMGDVFFKYVVTG
jgi:hypothetical protein